METKMYSFKKISPLIAAVALFVASAGVQAASVTFSDFLDDGFNNRFDISQNVTTDTTLTIGINNFKADGSSIITQAANDTLTFIITAQPGYYITNISYTEEGNGETGLGVATATGSIVADGIPRNFLTQVFGPNTSSGWSITPTDIAIDNKTQIAVSITNSLFALSLGVGETAEIEKTFAELTVGLTAIPLPPAVLMLGSALLGLATIGTRRRKS